MSEAERPGGLIPPAQSPERYWLFIPPHRKATARKSCATLPAMSRSSVFFFGYFWFSSPLGGREI
jgi:hypothetical protein